MPTARSWTEAVADLRHLLWFRARAVRRPRAVPLLVVAFVVVTLAHATAPALAPRPTADRLADLSSVLPGYLLALVAITVTTAIASGGGREVLAREPAAIHPIGPLADHLGALVLAPLSAAWLLQTWVLLALTATVAGPTPRLLLAQAVALAWVGAATALGQAVGWLAEWLRRGPHGVALSRAAVGAAIAVAGLLGALSGTRTALQEGPVEVVADSLTGAADVPVALAALAALVAAAVLLVLVGGATATLAAGRVPRDESRLESRSYPPRRLPGSDLALLVRLDRGSVWRSVPLRRGAWFLALTPGLVTLVQPLPWSTLTVLPGLVVSGCVLLVGVNVWCLDGRGLLWRESLPVAPGLTLAARTWVLAEMLLVAGAVTLLLGAVRAERPTPTEVLTVVVALLVVTGQGLSGALRWSQRSPYAVDLRSARATPAPPLAMVGYSVRLALATTLTTLALAGLGATGRPDLLLVVAAVLLAWSAARIARATRRWCDPADRARVVTTVAA